MFLYATDWQLLVLSDIMASIPTKILSLRFIWPETVVMLLLSKPPDFIDKSNFTLWHITTRKQCEDKPRFWRVLSSFYTVTILPFLIKVQWLWTQQKSCRGACDKGFSVICHLQPHFQTLLKKTKKHTNTSTHWIFERQSLNIAHKYRETDEGQAKLQFVLIHLLKIVTMSSRRRSHSLELDDLAL